MKNNEPGTFLGQPPQNNFKNSPGQNEAVKPRTAKPAIMHALFAYGLTLLLHSVVIVQAEVAPVRVAVTESTSAAQTGALAVLWIEDRRAQAPGDTSLMAGLTDVLAFSLKNRGTRMLDRQTVSHALGERRLNRLLGDFDAPLSKLQLPEAAFTVQGHLTRQVQAGKPDAQPAALELTIELYRTLDGSLLQRVTVPADNVAQLAEVIDIAAGAIDLNLIASVTRPTSETTGKLKGFTENPEAALMFYRGLEHLAANRNTLAAAYFITAKNYDWRFDAATIWQYRALERAGFHMLAKSLLQEDDKRRPGQLRKLLESTREIFADDRLVIAVASTPGTSVIARELEERWAKDPKLSVLTSSGVLGATAEQDLKLSGEFEHLPAVIDRWLFADVFVRVTQTQAIAYDVKNSVEIARCDLAQAGDGKWLRKAQLTRTQQAAPVFDVREQAMKARVTADPTGTIFMDAAVKGFNEARAADALPAYEAGEASKMAMLLERIVREPGNVSAWHALSEQSYNWGSGSSAQMMIDLIGKARQNQVGDDVPDAAAWLADASDTRYETAFHSPGLPYTNPLMSCELERPVPEQYPELLAWYPDSTAAWTVRFSIALELEELGHTDEALAMMLALAQRLPELSWPGGQAMPASVGPNVHYQLARMYSEQGNLQEATRWYEACATVIEAKKHAYNLGAKRQIVIRCRKEKVDWTIPSASGYSHRDTMVRMYTVAKYLTPRQRELGVHLANVIAGKAKLEAFETFADLHAQVLKETDASKRFDLQFRSVQKRLDVKRQRENTYSDTLTLRQIAWLRANAKSLVAHEAIDRLIDQSFMETNEVEINSNIRFGNTYALLMLRGKKQQVLEGLKYFTSPKNQTYSISFAYRQLEIASLEQPPAVQAQLILETIRTYETQNAEQVAAGSVQYYNLLAQFAPMLVMRGRFDEAAAMYQKIIDDPKVPWVYQDRARLHQAQAIWRAGRPEEAGELLRGVSERAVSRSSDSLPWDQLTKRVSGFYTFMKITPDSAQGLLHASRDGLHRLRLYGGRVKSDTTYQKKIEYAPLPDEPYAQAKLYALMILMSVPSRSHDFYGENWWSGEAARILQDMQEEAIPYTQRLLWSMYMTRQDGVDHEHDTAWRSLGSVYQYLGPKHFGPEHNQLQAMLLDWLAWSPVCEMKKSAAACLRATGIQSAQAATVLVLSAAMNDGCQGAARSTLMFTGRLEPEAARAVAALLDHPAGEVRVYAARTLANGVGMRIDNLKDVLPDEDTITTLREWWRSIDGDPARWPAADSSQQLVGTKFDESGARWLTWGAGPAAKVYQTGGKTIVLNHGEATCVIAASISRDGKVAATFAQDHKLRVWDLESPDKPRLILTPFLNPGAMTLGEHGNHIAYVQAGRLLIYDAHTGNNTYRLDHFGSYNGFTFIDANDTQLFVAINDYASPTLYDLTKRKVIDSVMGTDAGFKSVHLLEHGRLLTRGWDYTVRLWQTSPKLSNIWLEGKFGPQTVVTPSADLQRIAATDSDHHLGIWDAHTGKRLMDLGEVSRKHQAIAWPKDSGPVLIHRNLMIQRFSNDLKTSTMVTFEDKQMQSRDEMDPASASDFSVATAALDEHEKQTLTSRGDETCCQLIIRR